MSRPIVLGSVAAVLLLVAGIVIWRGADTSPAPLPEGATPLALRTQPPSWRLPLLPRACGLALLRPVRLVRDGEFLAFELINDRQQVPVVFPYGFTGWLVSGKAELVAPEGIVLAHEGDVLFRLGGSSADNGDFVVCFTSPDEYKQVLEPWPS